MGWSDCPTGVGCRFRGLAHEDDLAVLDAARRRRISRMMDSAVTLLPAPAHRRWRRSSPGSLCALRELVIRHAISGSGTGHEEPGPEEPCRSRRRHVEVPQKPE